MELLFLCLRAAYPPIARSPALRVGLNSPARRLSTLTGRWGNRSALSPIRLPLLRPFSLQIQPNKYSVGCGDIARGAREARTVKAVGLLCLWPRAAAAVQDSRAARILARSFPPIPNEARPRETARWIARPELSPEMSSPGARRRRRTPPRMSTRNSIGWVDADAPGLRAVRRRRA